MPERPPPSGSSAREDRPNEPETPRATHTEALRARAGATRLRFEERYGNTGPVSALRDVLLLDRAVAGGELAGALAYRLFLWFLPFVLVLVSTLGLYADAANTDPRTVTGRFGVTGLVATSVVAASRSNGRWWALLIGVPILIYFTRALLRTLVNVDRLAWGLAPKRGYITPANVLLFLVVLVGLLAVSAGVSATASRSGWWWFVVAPASVLARGAVWLGASSRLPHRPCAWTAFLPGALVVGVGFLVVNLVMLFALGEIAHSRHDSYGQLGITAAVLLSLFVTSRVVVLGAVANAALWGRDQGDGAAKL